MLRKAIPLAFFLATIAGATLCAQEYSFRSFGVTEGLTNLTVRRIFQDRVGFIWVSTENGIFRYDGDRFEAFGGVQGIPSNSGAAFGEAPDGSLLVGGDFGLYQQAGNRFEKLTVPFKAINWAEGIQSDGKGHTFLGTETGLVELSSQPGRNQFAIHRFPQAQGTSGPGAFGILIEKDVLWYGCGTELCRMTAQGTQVFGRDFGLPGMPVLVIQNDGVGNLWARVRNDGVFVRLAGHREFQKPKLPVSSEHLGGVPVTDGAGRILLPSSVGLLIGNENGWQQIDRSDGLRGTVYSAMEDRQRNLWIGLAGRGLAQWRGYREWETYSIESGLASDIVYEILPRDDGSLLLATEAGLFRGERRRSGMSFKRFAGLDGLAVHSLHSGPNGDLWIGTETRGAARIDSRTNKITWYGERQGLTGKAAYTLRFDRKQRLWAGTESGMFMAEAPYRRFSRIKELPASRIWAITEGSDGTIWAGGAGGLFELATDRWRTLTAADGLSNNEVLSLGAGPNGVIWVGYRFGGGIDRVHPKAGGVAIDKGIQRAGSDGLVYFLDFDSKGRLWAGTERGIDRWDGVHWSHYDTNDGLAGDDCNLNSFAEEADGTIWIGTSGGLSRFNALPRAAPDATLAVVFTRLSIGQKDASGLRSPSFGAHDNSFIARYSALNAMRENGVIFRYRLTGATSRWTETAQRELQFANLAPGAYRLEVDARDSDGAWSGNNAEFEFTILPPWYLTWWFESLCLLIPISVTAGVLRLRFLGAQRREDALTQLVEDRTADLRLANEELSRLSFTDPLTGLVNRRVFDQTLEMECARLTRTGAHLSLISIDVDCFKALNDSQGHPRGDECLVTLGAELMRIARRHIDIVARCGGEEFGIILPETDAAGAAQVAETVRSAIANLRIPHQASQVAPFLTVSVGVATATQDRFRTRKELADAADQALYAAKRTGRNRVCEACRQAAA